MAAKPDDLSAARWRASSYSSPDGNCVEVAPLSGGRVAVRDSKHRDGGVLVFGGADWQAFVAGVRRGEFD